MYADRVIGTQNIISYNINIVWYNIIWMNDKEYGKHDWLINY